MTRQIIAVVIDASLNGKLAILVEAVKGAPPRGHGTEFSSATQTQK
jgi:hypothetical protein